MNQQHDDQQEDGGKKKKSIIIFILSSIAALLVVGTIAFYALTRIQAKKASDVLSQDQFEGDVQISSQLQAECQSSAVKLSKMQEVFAMEAEYKQNAENCKDVYFALESGPGLRKEGMYADLVVDIAKQMSATDKVKALDLLKFAREIKSWDFYLGPVSCDSQHVLDAYIEAYSSNEEKTCFPPTEVQSKIIPELTNKNFAFLAKLIPSNDVVWLGAPESDLGCPEKISSVTEILKKMTPGAITVESAPNESGDPNQININMKLSDKETITLILQNDKECMKLSSVLVPNPDVSE